MGKQAMGIFLTNFLIRMHTMAYILKAPRDHTVHGVSQIPRTASRPKRHRCHSLLQWLQPRRFRYYESKLWSIYYRSYMDLEKKSEKPTRENTLRMKHGTYDRIEDDGLIAPGTGVSSEDITIGKTAHIPPDSEELGQRTRTHTGRDVSPPLKSTENGILDQVLITTNSEG
jgi:DNA-directed RNA polymerase II subunit RPB2